jgi:hypothetical protein
MTLIYQPTFGISTKNSPAQTTIKMKIPDRPAISNVLIKASANVAFRTKLLTRPEEALAEMNLPLEDAEILKSVQAPTLKEYAHLLKKKLLVAHI